MKERREERQFVLITVIVQNGFEIDLRLKLRQFTNPQFFAQA